MTFYDAFLVFMLLMAGVVFVSLFFVDAGYGQYLNRRWGKTINNRAGWVLMETPVVVLFAWYWFTSERTLASTPLVFFFLFNLHYCQRSFVFPLLIRGKDRMPLSIIVFGMLFNSANAYMQGQWIFFLSPREMYTSAWMYTPQFLIGTALFLAGFLVNIHSDHIIRTLRKPGDTGFHIPRGGMFEYVTAANYFGELTEWIGWAVLTWSAPGLVFAVWTFANLGPRAHRHHQWYHETFGAQYPAKRRRMIPFIY